MIPTSSPPRNANTLNSLGPDRLSRRQARGRRQGADPAPQPAARGQGWPVLPVGI